MRVNIVCPDQSWIFQKIARNLAECAQGVEIIHNTRHDPDADINYWFNWYLWHACGKPKTKCDLLFFTHCNEDEEMVAVSAVNDASHTTTMSTWETDKLLEHGAMPHKMTVILPGMDADWHYAGVRVGITCRFYNDKRRREWEMLELAERGALEGVTLYVIGQGWGKILSALTEYGVECIELGEGELDDDYNINHLVVPMLDYLWHPGIDTTLGVLDALACGVPIICHPTSFAPEFAINPQSAYWYQNVDQLEAIFWRIKGDLAHRASRAKLIGSWSRHRTWDVVASEMVDLFRNLEGANVQGNLDL